MRLRNDRLKNDGMEEDFAEEFDPSSLALERMTGSEQTWGGPTGSKQSRLISKVLSPALRLWVRSQLDHVEDLHLDIEASDLQLLSGAIQQVSAAARKGVYRGLHLSQISLVGEQIQTNLRQVLRGKPFCLLAAFPITGTVALSEADLNASLSAPLLTNAITEFLLSFLFPGQEEPPRTDFTPEAARVHDVQIYFGEEKLTFTGVLALSEHQIYPISIQTGLRIQDGNLLILERFRCQVDRSETGILPDQLPDRWVFNLGSEVNLEELRIQPDQICCRGRVMVQP